MTFRQHTEFVIRRAKINGKCFDYIAQKRGLTKRILVTLCKTLILPLVLYCAPVWTLDNYTRLNRFQEFILRNIMETTYNSNFKAAELLLIHPLQQTELANKRIDELYYNIKSTGAKHAHKQGRI